MTAFTEVVSSLGYRIERFIAEDGDVRGVAIATMRGGARALVSANLDFEGLERRMRQAPCALSLLDVARARHEGREVLLLAEDLPSGIPSSDPTLDARATWRAWGIALVEHVDATDIEARPVWAMRPELVFVAPEAPHVRAVCPRAAMLVAAKDPDPLVLDERPPVWGVFAPFYVPPDDGASLVHEIFQCAAVIWKWRHGRAPYASTLEDLQRYVEGKPPSLAPTDAIDEVLVHCFHRRGTERPSSKEVLAALRAG